MGRDSGGNILIWSMSSVMCAAAAAAVLLYSGIRLAVVFALVPAGVLVAAVVSRAALERRALGFILTWAGLIAPFVVVEQRNVGQIQGSLVTPLNVLQGLAPIVFFLGARLICRHRILPLRGCEPILLAFAAVCVLSMMWSVQPLATALRAVQLLVVYLLLILLVRQLGSSSAVVRHLIGAVYVAVAGVLLELVLNPSAALRPQLTYDFARQIYVTAPARLQGLLPYINPDLLGLLAVVALLGLVSGAGPRWSLTQPRQLLIGGGSLAVLLLSGARTAVLLLVLGLLILAVLDARSRSRVLVLAMFATAAVLVIPAVQGGLAQYLQRGQDPQSVATLTGRTTTWRDALAVWRQRPLTGYGYYAGHRFLGFAAARNLSNLDNMYIETLVDVGLVGLAVLVGFLLTGLRRLARSERCRARSLSIAVVVAALVGAAFNPSLQTPGVALIVAGGLLLAPWTPAVRRRYSPRGFPPRDTSGPIALSARR